MSERPKEMTCENCAFWWPIVVGGDFGECRINPPVILDSLANEMSVINATEFPRTRKSVWCGKLQRKDA